MNAPTESAPSHPKNADELIADISKLMAEAEEMLSESTSHHAEEHLELYRESNKPAGPKLLARYANAKSSLAMVARNTGEMIRTYPFESAAVALGLGVLVGACLNRKQS